MNNNDTFRKLLHLSGLGRDQKLVIQIFALGGINASKSQIKSWYTSRDNPRSGKMTDEILEAFFQGLFKYRDMMLDHDIQVFNFPSNNYEEKAR